MKLFSGMDRPSDSYPPHTHRPIRTYNKSLVSFSKWRFLASINFVLPELQAWTQRCNCDPWLGPNSINVADFGQCWAISTNSGATSTILAQLRPMSGRIRPISGDIDPSRPNFVTLLRPRPNLRRCRPNVADTASESAAVAPTCSTSPGIGRIRPSKVNVAQSWPGSPNSNESGSNCRRRTKLRTGQHV